MEALDLARLQFAVTTIFHFIFVPLTLGLSILVAYMQTRYFVTGREEYKRMTKFWGKLFLINFAMGVVTGIVQEFQFGMNWSEYSRMVGDIFGAPLAVEALMAFFIESTFLGLWIFGWDKLPKLAHLASIWLVAIAANVSAFWILVANSFMQNPVGFEMVGGRAQMTDFFALLTNPHVLLQWPHVVAGALTTATFFVMGVSAYHLLVRRDDANAVSMFRKSFTIGLVVGLFGILVTMGAGHAQGQWMADYQPMKLAAAEGLYEDEDPAALSFLQIRSFDEQTEYINITIPSLLSFMTYNTPDGMVRGINSLQAEYEETYGPGDYSPPVFITYWSFRAMVGAGFAMFALILFGLYLRVRGTEALLKRRFFLRLMIAAIALPFIANSTGWVLAEVGRQPWIVFGVQTVAQGVSPNVDATMILISLIAFTTIYTILFVADVYLLWKYGSNPDGFELVPQTEEVDPKAALKGAF